MYQCATEPKDGDGRRNRRADVIAGAVFVVVGGALSFSSIRNHTGF